MGDERKPHAGRRLRSVGVKTQRTMILADFIGRQDGTLFRVGLAHPDIPEGAQILRPDVDPADRLRPSFFVEHTSFEPVPEGDWPPPLDGDAEVVVTVLEAESVRPVAEGQDDLPSDPSPRELARVLESVACGLDQILAALCPAHGAPPASVRRARAAFEIGQLRNVRPLPSWVCGGITQLAALAGEDLWTDVALQLGSLYPAVVDALEAARARSKATA